MKWLRLEDEVQWVLGGILLLLVAAEIIVRVLRALRRDRDDAEIAARIRSWWVIFIIFVLAIGLGRTLSIVLFALLSYLALKEYLSLIPTRRADRRVLFWAYLAIPVQYYWIYLSWYEMFIVFVPVWMFLFLSMRMVLEGETRDFLRAIGTLHWGMMTMVFVIGHIAYLLVIPAKVGDAGAGPGLVVFLVLLTQLNDVAQFLWGKSLGRRHKVIPSVSPSKTIEGLAGGVLTTALLGGALGDWLTPLPWWEAALVGFIIGLAGFLGDVTMSALKRDLGVKDAGALIPGHGGVLDRIDSLTFTAPIFFHYMAYFYY